MQSANLNKNSKLENMAAQKCTSLSANTVNHFTTSIGCLIIKSVDMAKTVFILSNFAQ
jgi:hypothetical protein